MGSALMVALVGLIGCARAGGPGIIAPMPGESTARPTREPRLMEHRTSASAVVARTVNRFDGAGRLVTTERDEDGDGRVDQVIGRTYDSAGRLLSIDEGERVLRFQMDAMGRVEARTVEHRDQPVIVTAMTYDDRGRLVREADGLTVVQYQFDTAGRLLREQRFATDEQAPRAERVYTYNDLGQRAASDGFDETGRVHDTWQYDRRGRIVKSTLARNGVLMIATRVTYDRAGRRIAEEYRNAANTIIGRRLWTYDARGDLTTDETIDLVSHAWTRDRFFYNDGGAAPQGR
jgi:YD repeat-containing protein